MHAVCAPRAGAYDPAAQLAHEGVVVVVHEPFKYWPAGHWDVQVRHCVEVLAAG